jgi:hypothetical protein
MLRANCPALTVDLEAIEAAASDLLAALYAADDRSDGFKTERAPVIVAALADCGWSVGDVLAFGADSELAALLPETQRDRELAESNAEGATVWFGEPEHGKSLAAQAAAVEAMRAGLKVVHLDGEQGSQDAGAAYLALGANPAEQASLGLLHYEYDDAINFDGAYLAGLAPSLVIVDSFARLAAARGITDAQYAAQGNLMTELQAFGLRNGCAVLVIDHTTKSPGKGDRYAFGAGSKLGAARGQFFVKRERKFSPDKAGAVSFTNVKGRRPGLPDWQRFEVGGQGVETISFRASLDKSVPADRIELDVLEFVRAQGKPLSQNKIRQSITGKNDVIDAATDRLVKRGALREVRTGVYPKFEAVPETPGT